MIGVVSGEFGVFDGVDCIAQFSNDQDAEEFRDATLELHVPEPFRRPEYDDLQVCEIPEGYAQLHRLLVGLRKSLFADLAIERALTRLRRAQGERAEVRRAAA